MLPFENRTDAGRRLGAALTEYAGRSDVTVLALARGGLPVGRQVAESLQAPLDVFLVRKLGMPGREELAMGAIASGGVRCINRQIVEAAGVSAEEMQRVLRLEMEELGRRERAYRRGRPPAAVQGRVAILVDDGLATGASMQAALQAVRRLDPARIVVAVPVAAPMVRSRLEERVDHMICLETPWPFRAVGMWYRSFPQLTDEEVREILRQAEPVRSSPSSGLTAP
jgi:putative phosphoribosyl transferase